MQCIVLSRSILIPSRIISFYVVFLSERSCSHFKVRACKPKSGFKNWLIQDDYPKSTVCKRALCFLTCCSQSLLYFLNQILPLLNGKLSDFVIVLNDWRGWCSTAAQPRAGDEEPRPRRYRVAYRYKFTFLTVFLSKLMSLSSLSFTTIGFYRHLTFWEGGGWGRTLSSNKWAVISGIYR